MFGGKKKKVVFSFGVICLDYDYFLVFGDIDCLDFFDCDVYYKVVFGFMFEMC